MTTDYRVYPEKDAVAVIARGRVRFRDFVLQLKRLLEDEQVRGLSKKIIDLREALLVLSANDALIAAQVERLQNLRMGARKVAVLLPEASDRSMVRILERRSVDIGVEVRVFHDDVSAVRWLNERPVADQTAR